MNTIHMTNIPFSYQSPTGRLVMGLACLIAFFLLILSPGIQQALLSLFGLIAFFVVTHFLIEKSKVSFTLTATHFQQHMFKGGWVVRWNNISHIGVCTYSQEGWHQPIPWIGIKLKDYEPYLDNICPRISTQILLEQRSLLYLGLKQMDNKNIPFEDIVLDSKPYESSNGEQYTGLQAMLANRMAYQRENFGYDIFISTSDLDRSGDEFVGLARRFLAAADKEDLIN
ncbi:DUF2982 domain-containing protein [Vibrio nigripulchritudo]|uniref:DUF2982 domain-containing protein n=1 Tax=Vibrio nigripulchritudo TaxID=28173 RepID=UPI0005FA74AB|nr:DUF2982 domain-containing protein [Vibrio nigripulchritudo]KJY80897.1 hypothetical protein TW74_00960 [Vibrio nigripulchritudo]